MTVSMPPDLDAFIHQAVATGMYESEEAVIVAGLRLLQDRSRRLEELRDELRPALEELDRGEGKPLDIEDVIRRGHERLASEKSKGN
ncbi:MAG: type II toxin-antitoxin system ParD family antitoxin [Pirellulales bacterium]|nr:type II toxin-antitoxin system ParD family antitoxin [Pirellulales bacterium]